jgi:tetratricopeptide (TPR) repeat protein
MLLKEAITSMEEDNYNVAEEKLNDLVAHNPRYFDAYWYLGQCREKNGRKNDALKAYKKYAKAPPRQYEKLRYLARFFEESGDFKTAIPMRTAALKQKQTAEDYYILGNSYYQIKDYDNAGKYLSLATKLDKNNYFYHVLLAQARAKSGQKADAIKAYKRAYEINTDKTALLYQIALLANETGDYRTAREYLNLYIYQEYDAEKSQKAKQLLNKVKISIMKQLPPGIEKRTDFLPGVSVIGIMKYGESKKAYLRIQGYQEEVTEGQTIMDKYYVISIRESMVVLGDPETETYMVLKPL